MKFSLLLNVHSGTVQDIGAEVIEDKFSKSFKAAGHDTSVHHFGSGDLIEALKKCASSGCDGIIMCGGDGSASAAASVLTGSDVALGVLPGGTMNLYARSLGMPLDIIEAIEALAFAEIRKADVGCANGLIFVHQFATGFQTRAVKLREKMDFGSKFSKMFASTKAIFSVTVNPPIYKLEMSLDGGQFQPVKSSLFAVTNNIFGVGHLPYADEIDGGKLGVYFTEPLSRLAAVKIIRDTVLGTLHDNEFVSTDTAEQVTLRFPKLKKSDQAVIDGELIKLEEQVDIKIMKQALRVLVPNKV
ncbi:diacylglycerol kinase family protein [Ahrensia kielensis]|uniref:Diacylglycerol kinase family protein n=1 Tax=Ahrensia kielensis TaxID=76980 RepID=A0ABU9T5E6_9HYPH